MAYLLCGFESNWLLGPDLAGPVLTLLHAQANQICGPAGLLVSMFQYSSQLQSHLLEEVVSKVLPSLPSAKRCHKAWVVGDSKSAVIQVITATLIQMVQV